MHPDGPGRGLDIFLPDFRVLQGNVVGDGIGKEENVLEHYRYIAPQGGQAVFLDIGAVEPDMARLYVVETVQKVDDGRLPGPGGPDNGYFFPGLQGEGNAVQHLLARHVGEVHLVEFDGPVHMPHLPAARIFDAAFGVEDLEDPAGGHHPHLQGIEFIGDLPKGPEEHFDEQNKGEDVPHVLGSGVGDILQYPVPGHQADGDGRDDLGNREKEGVVPDRLEPGILVFFVDIPEFGALDAFPPEELHHLHAGEAFLHKGVQVGHLGPHLGKGHLHLLLEDAGGIQDKRQNGKHDQGQLPVEHQHDHRGGQHLEQVGHDHEKALGEDFPDALHVGHGPGDKHPDRRLVVVFHAEAQHAAEEFLPHVFDDRFAQPAGVIGKEELADHLPDQHPQHGQGEGKQVVGIFQLDRLVDDLAQENGGVY